MTSDEEVVPNYKACLSAESFRFGSKSTKASRDLLAACMTKKGAVVLCFTFDPYLTLVTSFSSSYLGD
jgi:hypothetical protein